MQRTARKKESITPKWYENTEKSMDQKYFHDNLNRVMVTAKEELVNCLPHKWVEPVTIPLVY